MIPEDVYKEHVASAHETGYEEARAERDAEWLAAIDDTREAWNMSADYILVKGFEGFFKECLKTFCDELKARMTGETEVKTMNKEVKEQMSPEAFEEVAYAVADAVSARDAEWLAAIEKSHRNLDKIIEDNYTRNRMRQTLDVLKAHMTGETD